MHASPVLSHTFAAVVMCSLGAMEVSPTHGHPRVRSCPGVQSNLPRKWIASGIDPESRSTGASNLPNHRDASRWWLLQWLMTGRDFRLAGRSDRRCVRGSVPWCDRNAAADQHRPNSASTVRVHLEVGAGRWVATCDTELPNTRLPRSAAISPQRLLVELPDFHVNRFTRRALPLGIHEGHHGHADDSV